MPVAKQDETVARVDRGKPRRPGSVVGGGEEFAAGEHHSYQESKAARVCRVHCYGLPQSQH